jgi:hypothetical protein
MRSNMLIRSVPFHLALTRNLGAVVAVNWASADARHRVIKTKEEDHKKCNPRSRIDLLRFRKPMEPILTVCRIAVDY